MENILWGIGHELKLKNINHAQDCSHFSSIPFDKIVRSLFEPGSASDIVKFPPKPLSTHITQTIHIIKMVDMFKSMRLKPAWAVRENGSGLSL